ncbi:hypothetical protein DENSPDRAFT_854378 [Dentipellis sp. KUC8613]|nr:hypothetical protein DENSPDRAFT_854378 [Dentipellis sp. KUC8613]
MHVLRHCWGVQGHVWVCGAVRLRAMLLHACASGARTAVVTLLERAGPHGRMRSHESLCEVERAAAPDGVAGARNVREGCAGMSDGTVRKGAGENSTMTVAVRCRRWGERVSLWNEAAPVGRETASVGHGGGATGPSVAPFVPRGACCIIAGARGAARVWTRRREHGQGGKSTSGQHEGRTASQDVPAASLLREGCKGRGGVKTAWGAQTATMGPEDCAMGRADGGGGCKTTPMGTEDGTAPWGATVRTDSGGARTRPMGPEHGGVGRVTHGWTRVRDGGDTKESAGTWWRLRGRGAARKQRLSARIGTAQREIAGQGAQLRRWGSLGRQASLGRGAASLRSEAASVGRQTASMGSQMVLVGREAVPGAPDAVVERQIALLGPGEASLARGVASLARQRASRAPEGVTGACSGVDGAQARGLRWQREATSHEPRDGGAGGGVAGAPSGARGWSR